MDIDSGFGERGDFSLDQPIEALKKDHELARRLFDEYFRAPEDNARKNIGRRLLLLLETHSVLEENVFYWRAHATDPALVERCQEEHRHIDRLVERLRLALENGVDMRRLDRLFRRL